MSKSEIDHLVWYEKRHRIVLTNRNGSHERMMASERVAALIAEAAGLVRVASSPGTVRWTHDPDSEALSWGQGHRIEPLVK
jgi:hypothetical protein